MTGNQSIEFQPSKIQYLLCKFILNSIKLINRDRPGSDLAAGVAAAFASYSLVSLKVTEDDAKDYLMRARSLLDFAIKYKGKN